MIKRELICRLCGVKLNESNIGYVSTSKAHAIFECRACHYQPPPPKPQFKSWQLLGRKLHY